jgi:hypothetical protein
MQSLEITLNQTLVSLEYPHSFTAVIPAALTTERMAAFMPGASPPDVKTAIFFMLLNPMVGWSNSRQITDGARIYVAIYSYTKA